VNSFSAENSPGIAYPKRVGIGVLLISNMECGMEGHKTGAWCREKQSGKRSLVFASIWYALWCSFLTYKFRVAINHAVK
jgi:hypothetical protein